jgi:SpoVK/Ycf46/Vps4 family AAA+-type ATPase
MCVIDFPAAADRCVYVGEEVCVTQMNETYSFVVADIDADDAALPSDALEAEEKKRAPESDVAAAMQRLAIDPSSAAAAAVAAAEPAPSFPRLYAVHSTTRVALASASDPASPSSTASSDRSVGLVSGAISADDIGGLEAEIGALRQLLEWTPEKASAFAHYNIKPPKGILLYGPPGTGQWNGQLAWAAQTMRKRMFVQFISLTRFSFLFLVPLHLSQARR